MHVDRSIHISARNTNFEPSILCSLAFFTMNIPCIPVATLEHSSADILRPLSQTRSSRDEKKLDQTPPCGQD